MSAQSPSAPSVSDSALETLSIDISDETAGSLVDAYCARLSAGSQLAYREALDSRSAQGADAVSARHFALYQAVVHQSIESALAERLARDGQIELGAGQSRRSKLASSLD